MAAAPLPASLRKGSKLPSERARYADRATELLVLRLTDPQFSSYLPNPRGHLASKRRQLLFWSDREGSQQAYTLDWNNGEIRLLTEAEALEGDTLTLGSGERDFYYWDGRALIRSTLSNLRTRTVFELPEGSERGQGFSVATNEESAAFIEKKNGRYRLATIDMRSGKAATLIESPYELRDPTWRPNAREILYRAGNRLVLAKEQSSSHRDLPVAEGGLGPHYWNPDGGAVLYLSIRSQLRQLNEIREIDLATGEDRVVGRTSQFATFSPNPDGTVFAGASANKAGPFVMVLLRNPPREFTLCEHRAHDPAAVNPVFSPNSQTVFFQSDLHGKSALYSVTVDLLLEETS
jgi:oligogalacturonide lyase